VANLLCVCERKRAVSWIKYLFVSGNVFELFISKLFRDCIPRLAALDLLFVSFNVLISSVYSVGRSCDSLTMLVDLSRVNSDFRNI